MIIIAMFVVSINYQRKINKMKYTIEENNTITRSVIVNINIEIPTPTAKTDEEAEEMAQDYELPSEYVEDSFEIVKVITEE